eukprot:Skav210735  [mRNA]  locus=scaffold449:62002:62503:- [translate_table: standard]
MADVFQWVERLTKSPRSPNLNRQDQEVYKHLVDSGPSLSSAPRKSAFRESLDLKARLGHHPRPRRCLLH